MYCRITCAFHLAAEAAAVAEDTREGGIDEDAVITHAAIDSSAKIVFESQSTDQSTATIAVEAAAAAIPIEDDMSASPLCCPVVIAFYHACAADRLTLHRSTTVKNARTEDSGRNWFTLYFFVHGKSKEDEGKGSDG
jgi:hypothetical protein